MSVFSDMDKAQENNQLEQPTESQSTTNAL
jgi:hypothetical protein